MTKGQGTKYKGKYIHNVTASDCGSTSDTNGLACLKLHSVTGSEDRKIIWVSPDVSGVKLKMELDTGSALSVISYADYKRLLPNLPLLKTSVELKTYRGHKVLPKGNPSDDSCPYTAMGTFPRSPYNIEFKGTKQHWQLVTSTSAFNRERGGFFSRPSGDDSYNRTSCL